MAQGRKTGGRVAGTPNKVSSTVRGAIAKMLDEYFNSDIFVKDIAGLDPKDRVAAMESLQLMLHRNCRQQHLMSQQRRKRPLRISWSNLLGMKRTTKNNLLLSTLDERSCLPLGV
jgi:hypothetical protein